MIYWTPQNFNELATISKEWDRLVDESEFPNIFSSWGFNLAWWQAHGEGKILRTIVIRDDNKKVRLIAPFYALKTNPKSLKLLCNISGDYNDILFKSDDIESVELLFSWLYTQKNWDEIVIDRMPSTGIPNYFKYANHLDTTLYEKMRYWFSIGTPLVYRVWNYQHPYAIGKNLEQMHNLIDTKNYKRHVNWFNRNGDFKYRTITSATEIYDLLPSFMAMHIKEWNSKGQNSLFEYPRAKIFYESLTKEMAGYGTLRMDLLEFNGDMVAAHFGFQDNTRFYFYKPCFNPDYSKRCPGKLLMAYMIRRTVEENLETFDLLLGLDAYKDRYANKKRKTAFLHIQRSRSHVLFNRFNNLLRNAD